MLCSYKNFKNDDFAKLKEHYNSNDIRETTFVGDSSEMNIIPTPEGSQMIIGNLKSANSEILDELPVVVAEEMRRADAGTGTPDAWGEPPKECAWGAGSARATRARARARSLKTSLPRSLQADPRRRPEPATRTLDAQTGENSRRLRTEIEAELRANLYGNEPRGNDKDEKLSKSERITDFKLEEKERGGSGLVDYITRSLGIIQK